MTTIKDINSASTLMEGEAREHAWWRERGMTMDFGVVTRRRVMRYIEQLEEQVRDLARVASCL